ncbi:MAG: AraC family transcriptional regulator [Verrucomicrobiales bacterium]
MRKAKRFVAENLGDRIALEDVAKHSGVSTFYFCKVFKASTGMCFTEYVNRVRVEKAKALLNHPEHRITEVAYAVGFQSLSQFNRSFQKYAGESPTEFRRRIRGEEAVAA